MNVEYHGTPNIQRMFEVWAAILAERDGREVVPGSVKVVTTSGVTEKAKRIKNKTLTE